MPTPFKPPRGITVEVPYRSIVLRADPDFEYKNRHQLFYEFSNGRDFFEDENQHGAYLPSGPASIMLSGVGSAGSVGLVFQMGPHLSGVGGVGAATHVTGIGTEADIPLSGVAANASAGNVLTTTPVGAFTVGVNITGAQAPFPQFASQACHTYFANRLTGSNNPEIINRLPFCWVETNSAAPFTGFVGAQPTAFGPLDTTSTVYGGTTGYMGKIAEQIQFAINAGSKLFLDCHNFGFGPGGLAVGSPGLPTTAFADLWGKIATYLMANPSLLPGVDGLDLMNEWVNGFDSSVIFTANQQAIDAIRDAGYTGKIYIEGTNFSSAWNWTSGDGQPFNSSGLSALVDPLNNLVFQPHMYVDPDDSGSEATSFSYAVSLTIPGVSPVGLNLNPTIGVTRMSREYVPWQQSNGLRGLLGETGISNDSPWHQGAFDYADWNVVHDNLMAYLQTNKTGIALWSGGPGFAVGYGPFGYAYALDSFNVNLSGQPDYTSTGVQHPAWTMIDKYTGYTGPQPQAYMLFQPGLNNPVFYCTQGTPSDPFTVYYGGKITSPVTITPHDFLFDGVTSAAGTFTPATVTLAAGDNALATFTYTASQAATLIITTTNSAGWHDPPPISMSSIVDAYAVLPTASLTNIYGLYNRYSPNTGPALRLARVSDGQQLDWGFSLDGKNFDRNAIQTWAGAQSGISIVTIYGIGPSQQNPITFSNPATRPTFNLQNAAGYPQIEVNHGSFGEFNTPADGQHAFTTIYRINQSSSAAMGPYRMDWFSGPIDCSNVGFSLGDSANYSANHVTVNFNVVNAAYHEYAATWVDAATNGFIAYKDGASQNTATYSAPTVPVVVGTTPFGVGLNPGFGSTTVEFGFFKFFTGTQWRGSMTSLEIFEGYAASPTDIASINTFDSTYYSTPLPDVLAAPPPVIANLLVNQPIYPGQVPARPFGVISITDPTGGATDTVTITLTGAAGTLSGSGVSGTGPYTVGPDTPANVSAIMQSAVFTTAAGVGSTTTFGLSVLSSSGGLGTSSSTSTVVTTYSAQTAFTPPVGTFIPQNYSGYNLAGGELNPTFGLFPSTYEIDYLASKGFGLVRLVLTSQYWYTAVFNQLNSTYLASIKTFVDYCFTKNVFVVLDPHDIGYVWDSGAINPARGDNFWEILPNVRSQDAFADFWGRNAAAFKNYPNVIFGLMNEPTPQTAVIWRDGGVTPSIVAIRAAGATSQLILIPGAGQSSALGWASNGNSAAFAGYAGDPNNNFAFEAHQYLDASASGGSPVATLNGSTILNTLNTFLTANSFKGFLGEFGMCWTDPWYPVAAGSNEHYDPAQTTPQTTNSVSHNSDMLTVVTTSGLYVGWAAWGGGKEFGPPKNANAYFFQMEPQRSPQNGGTIVWEQPQIPTLVSFITVASGYDNVNNWPSVGLYGETPNRPMTAGSTLSWIGPVGGGPSTTSDIRQTRVLTASGGITASANNQVIQGLDILGNIDSNGKTGGILRQCRIKWSSGFFQILMTSAATGWLIEDCEIDGSSGGGFEGIGLSLTNAIVRRCYFHDMENGISDSQNGTTKIVDCVFYHLMGSDNDGIEMNDNSTFIDVEHCTFDGSTTSGNNSGFNITNVAGGTTGAKVNGNRFVNFATNFGICDGSSGTSGEVIAECKNNMFFGNHLRRRGGATITTNSGNFDGASASALTGTLVGGTGII